MPIISWAGHEWEVRTWGGPPAANGKWSADNVRVDDKGYLRLRISRQPDGSPVSAEINSRRVGWGYGTFRFVMGSAARFIPRTAVLGLFTYGGDGTYGHREIDFEAASWGRSAPVEWHHTHYGNGQANVLGTKAPPSADVLVVHELTWLPGSLRWVTYRADGMLLMETSTTVDVARPLDEQVILNYWVFNAPGWESTPAGEVIIRDFRFTPHPAQLVAGE